jgi:hypothetical protein
MEGLWIRCAAGQGGPTLAREGERERCVNMVGCMLPCIDHGPCRKMADEQGGLRGVKRLMVEAGGGAIIGQTRCGSSKEPAVRRGRDTTGLGNACTACCGVLLSMPP